MKNRELIRIPSSPSKPQGSMKTVVPDDIANIMEIYSGDILEWIIGIRDNKIEVLIDALRLEENDDKEFTHIIINDKTDFHEIRRYQRKVTKSGNSLSTVVPTTVVGIMQIKVEDKIEWILSMHGDELQLSIDVSRKKESDDYSLIV